MNKYVRIAVLASTGLAVAAGADDRELLRLTSSDPFVFVIFDVSGSMAWTPRSDECPTGDCLPRMMGDDPKSKLYQAKEALYEVIGDVENVHFGFATYNQDEIRVRGKNWLYRVTSNGPRLRNGSGTTLARFPTAGQEVTFGYSFPCDTGNGAEQEMGCYPLQDAGGNDKSGRQADLGDAWEVERVLRHPKLHTNQTTATSYYVRVNNDNNLVFRITWSAVGGQTLGTPTFTSNVRAERCTNARCTTVDSARAETVAVTYSADLDADGVVEPNDFLGWDLQPSRNDPQGGWFAQGNAADVIIDSYRPDNTNCSASFCSGWDSNDDTAEDRFSWSYNLKQVTQTDPRGPRFSIGDVVPLDWVDKTASRDLVLSRLAPNGSFRQASYFQDHPNGDGVLPLRDTRFKPLMASGATPLGRSMASFRTWYRGTGNTTATRGFRDIAAASDPDWACRRVYLLVFTDGDESCCGAPATVAGQLLDDDDIHTYVVAFGVEDTEGNAIADIAEQGGTTAIYPQNQDALVAALTSIFGEIEEDTRAFASATVPSVQADISDRLYLTRFVPLNSEPVWPGSLDAFLKPLPLNNGGQAILTIPCTEDRTSGCRLWDAGEEMLSQAPSQDDIDSGVYRIGLGEDQRRVFYVQDPPAAAVPAPMRTFLPPAGDPGSCALYPLVAGCGAWWDLFQGLGLGPGPGADVLRDRATGIIGQTLVVKEAVIERPGNTPLDVSYILGDLFHSDPLYVERPSDFDAYANDLFGEGRTCDGADPDPGYRCYANKHRLRRKMLLVGANDGMMHAFDAGQWDSDAKGFTTGTGLELFAVIPRAAMPVLREQAFGDDQIYSMDGSPRVGDAFIDPVHNGTPTPSEREWRTVLVTGMREGGNKFPSQAWVDRFENAVPLERMRNAYVAIDITQPDPYDAFGEPTQDLNVVPACLTLNGTVPSGCGGGVSAEVPFPAVLWEFRDEHPTRRRPFDEDANGQPDLGDTWSRPILGRVMLAGGDSREVAVFGGGMDTPTRDGEIGNWIYMVDVETGRTIYKREVVGAIPAEIAAQDRDNNGYLDTLYFGTTAGVIYKVDLRSIPELEPVTVRDIDGDTSFVQLRVTNLDWEPFPIFQTGPAGSPGPVFFAPTVFYLSQVGGYVLTFGTGDREDLWSDRYGPARFYVIRDLGFTRAQFLGGDLPKSEIDYQQSSASLTGSMVGTDLVLRPASDMLPGWYFILEETERVTTRGAGLAGLLSFTAFTPLIEFVEDDIEGDLCARTGRSRIFAVDARNGDPLAIGAEGEGGRYKEVAGVPTPPTLEQVQSKNDATGDVIDDELTEYQKNVLESIMKMFPPETRFANYYYALVQRTSRSEQIDPLLIPIGIMQKNWKEF